jgi:hypothetical protein
VIAVGLTDTTHTTTGLTTGNYYKFKVESRNYLYYSELSADIQILCATKPVVPDTPTSTNEANYVIIDWEAPFNNGIVISSYVISFRTLADTYVTDSTYCDGTDSDIVANTQCTIPLETLTAAPYSLGLGDPVNVKIAAGNTYGTSD